MNRQLASLALARSYWLLLDRATVANGVGLSFYYGATLSDPHKLLLGSGSQNRFIRIESAATLARPEVEEPIAAAIAQAERPLPGSGNNETCQSSPGNSLLVNVNRETRQMSGCGKLL
jgi:hypothetical protein